MSASDAGLTLIASSQEDGYVVHNENMDVLGDVLFRKSETLDLSVATATTLEFPARCQVLGVSWRFTADVTYSGGGATVTIGDGGDGAGVAADADRYASGLTGASGSSGAGPVTPFPIFGAMPVELAPDAGAITGGTVILTLHALRLPVPPAP